MLGGIAKIRKIGRFTLASHPDIVRELFSAYTRDQRRALKKKNRQAEDPDGEGDLPMRPPTDQTPAPA